MTKVTGRKLNRELGLGAVHALYHKDGCWYDQLQHFPGVLFDRQGYVRFEDRNAYVACGQLRHPAGERADGRPGTLTVPDGIAAIPNYVRDVRIDAFHA